MLPIDHYREYTASLIVNILECGGSTPLLLATWRNSVY
jgi:hypothetical protein